VTEYIDVISELLIFEVDGVIGRRALSDLKELRPGRIGGVEPKKK
jgi:hypothetical protein